MSLSSVAHMREEQMMQKIERSFLTSEKLRRHVDCLLAHGCMYSIANSNLMYHATVPLNADGTLKEVEIGEKKYKGLVNKRRVAVPMEEAERFLINGILPSKPNQIFKEIDYLFNHYDLEPKRYIAYDRIAMFGKEDPDFRVTFDKDIRSRVFDLTLYKDDENDYLLPSGYRLMEVKIADSVPIWFAKLLSKYELYSISFSKYGNFYKKQLLTEAGGIVARGAEAKSILGGAVI